jgi:hypothetical protein
MSNEQLEARLREMARSPYYATARRDLLAAADELVALTQLRATSARLTEKAALWDWLEQEATVRCIGTTPRRPQGLFTVEGVQLHLMGIGFVWDEQGSYTFPTLADAVRRVLAPHDAGGGDGSDLEPQSCDSEHCSRLAVRFAGHPLAGGTFALCEPCYERHMRQLDVRPERTTRGGGDGE